MEQLQMWPRWTLEPWHPRRGCTRFGCSTAQRWGVIQPSWQCDLMMQWAIMTLVILVASWFTLRAITHTCFHRVSHSQHWESSKTTYLMVYKLGGLQMVQQCSLITLFCNEWYFIFIHKNGHTQSTQQPACWFVMWGCKMNLWQHDFPVVSKEL